MWHADSKEIRKLLEFSANKFDTEIPLAKEIWHLSHFCWELSTFFNKYDDSVKLELQKRKPQNAILKWFHCTMFGGRTETIEIPEDAIWEIHGWCLKHLDNKCEILAEMCGWYKNHPKE